jgi:uncharacterized protein (TIGR02284 family)
MSTSTDVKITRDLLQTLVDGADGFGKAAEKLAKDDRPDIATKFREYSNQRTQLASELRTVAAKYGDRLDESGSVAATVHRGWMTLKDALAGSDPGGVLDAAEQGEDHAVSEYDKALEEKDISAELRTVVERQYATVKHTHDDVRALRDANN